MFFDRTVQITNVWLQEITGDLGPDRNHAWHVLGGVQRSLRDQLQAELAAHLAARLPLLVRAAFYEAWNPAAAARRARSPKEFLAKLEDNLADTRPTNTAQAAQAVFGVLSRHVDHEQVVNVRNALSEQVRRLWPESLLAEGTGVPSGRHLSIEQRAYEIWKELGDPAEMPSPTGSRQSTRLTVHLRPPINTRRPIGRQTPNAGSARNTASRLIAAESAIVDERVLDRWHAPGAPTI